MITSVIICKISLSVRGCSHITSAKMGVSWTSLPSSVSNGQLLDDPPPTPTPSSEFAIIWLGEGWAWTVNTLEYVTFLIQWLYVVNYQTLLQIKMIFSSQVFFKWKDDLLDWCNVTLLMWLLQFCQTLANMGQTINLSLKLQYFLAHQQGYHHPGLQEGRNWKNNCEGGEEADTLSKKKKPEKEGRILEKEICIFCGSLWLWCSRE